MGTIARLYVDVDLSDSVDIILPEPQSHYLLRVMRRGVGDEVTLFNGRHGEWRCEIVSADKKAAGLRACEQTRAQTLPGDLWLLFAPLRVKARMSFLVEKSVELGAAKLQPVMTERTQGERVRIDKLSATAIEAAEQTERLGVPPIAAPVKLADLIDRWDTGRQIIYADECGDDERRPLGGVPGRGAPMAEVLRAKGTSKAAILIGPEGGFSREERMQLRALEFVIPVSLGPRILRAETAAVAALTIWQSVVGDWR